MTDATVKKNNEQDPNQTIIWITSVLFLLVGVIGRLVIHIPDVTPLTSLCLLAPIVFAPRIVFLITTLILLLSDAALHYLFHFPVFGMWTLFTYSGWFGVTLLGFLLRKKQGFLQTILFTCCATFLFWLWTNFGTFMTTHLYPHHFSGFLQCYIAALPFLKNSLIGSCAWSSILFYFIFLLNRHSAAQSNNPIHFLR